MSQQDECKSGDTKRYNDILEIIVVFIILKWITIYELMQKYQIKILNFNICFQFHTIF